MTDIFISYASADRAVAGQLADALKAFGWTVWWDREIPLGKPFDQVIEEELNSARCVIVLWSKESMRSRWVKTEAGAAADRNCLIPVLIEDVPISMEFRRIQTAMLQGWKGDRNFPGYAMLVSSIKKMLGEPASQPPLPTRTQDSRTSPPSSGHGKKLAIGVAIAVLAALTGVTGKMLLRSSEPGSSGVSADPSSGPAPVSPEPSSRPAPQAPPLDQEATPVSESAEAPTATTPPPTSAPAPQTKPPDKEATADSESAEAPAATTPPPTPGKGAFAIKIGDTIKENMPSPGAGNIESPGVKDVYTFSAAPGQTVYFRNLKHDPAVAYLRWILTDADGNEVFNSYLSSEPGAKVLKKGGTYTLTVGSDQTPGTGTYHLQLLNVPPAHEFGIKIGDTIKENMPGPGAGNIESPGVKDVYTFSAAPGQTVYFRNLKHDPAVVYLRWILTDADGNEVFNGYLSSEPGAKVLKKGGTYTLTVGSDQTPGTGTYHLQLLNVPPAHEFGIKIGDTIKENMPGPGAGNIESPGVKDVYTFSAAPGQTVYFRNLKHDPAVVYLRWILTDADGNEVFNGYLSSEPGAKVLKKGGTYTLTVGSDEAPATGTYSLQLSDVAG